MDKFLYENLKEKAYDLDLGKQRVPSYISDNLKFPLFDWQEKAIEQFILFQKIKEVESPNTPTHLLFNMATGAGKTLVMAAMILHYYKQGYRSFIFFVNQNNIVDKTENNLTDPFHTKYLFTNPIVIEEKTINIKKVETFSIDTDDIEIKFTSIHKLHNAVYQVRENDIFLDDLQNRKLVMLADEAHHLNSDTKVNKPAIGELNLITELKQNASAKDVEKSWEHTVTNLLLNRGYKSIGANPNVLLEFTATLPTNAYVVEKYRDKIISRFDLKDFLNAGFTKEINLVSSSFNKKQRILQALLFNWYRYRIALDNGIPHFKPVILFRSKFADNKLEGNVEEDFNFFQNILENLTPTDFDFLKTIEVEKAEKIYEVGQSRIIDIVSYLENNSSQDITRIIAYLKDTFKPTNCITTTSADKTAKGFDGKEKTTSEQDDKLNNLEDKNNNITAVFTCQRLTEGWDVLNLYDIVRMYEGQNTGGSNKNKAGSSTVSEVQLIGRGVRYYPFKHQDNIPNKRKFDKELDHPMRVLEEFYFHSDKDERYISELKKELKRQELLPDNKIVKNLDIKEEIKNDKTSFYNTMLIFGNEQQDNPQRRKSTLQDLKDSMVVKVYNIPTFKINELHINFNSKNDEVRLDKGTEDGRSITREIKDFYKDNRNVLYKALNTQAKKHNSIFKFKNLQKELEIKSIDDLWDNKMLGNFKLPIILPKSYENFDSVPAEIKVDILIKFFEQFEIEFNGTVNPYIGSNFRSYSFSKYFDKPKAIAVVEDEKIIQIEKKLVSKDWYALNGFYGTSEEINLIEFIENTIENFKDKYDNVYLLRNEIIYKIYDFQQGRGFMPDFLLFLKDKEKNLYFQVFIEPKGVDRLTNENSLWKDKFLVEITQKYGRDVVLNEENKDYKLIGLPLYNATVEPVFKKAIYDNLSINL